MKRAFLVSAVFLGLVGGAAAADLPRKMPVKALPPAPVYDWNGFYIGGYYAASINQSEATSTAQPGTIGLNSERYGGGIDLGYNWQFNPSWLVGIEGDLGYLGTKRAFQDFSDANFPGLKSTWYGTLRGRLGYVTGPSLLYVTGGGAWVRLEERFGSAPTTVKTTDSGWAVGGGIETKLSRGWTAKSEYLFVDLGSNSFAAGTDTATFKNQFHVLKTGLNYKFGEPFELPFMLASLSSPQRWAGWYAGVNVGGGLSEVRTPTTTGLLNVGGEVDVNGGGFAGGGHLGYNLVAFSNWIVGVEGDIGYLGVKEAKPDWFNTGVSGDLYQPGVDTSWYGTVRGRVGTATGPALLYATGGFAAVNVKNSLAYTVVPVAGGTYSVEGIRTGWTFGGGIEVELTPQWSARLEDLYINVGKDSVSTPSGSVEFKNNFHVIRAGVSYKFGGPDVLATKY